MNGRGRKGHGDYAPYWMPTSTWGEVHRSIYRGKHVWERNSCINCHSLLGEGAYFAPELGNVWVRYGGREDPEGARALVAWMQSQPSGIEGTPSDAAVQPDRPGTERPCRFPGMDQPHQNSGLAAERRGLRNAFAGKTLAGGGANE